VYATGRDRSGQTQEFSLNTGTGQWTPVPQGTVARRTAQLQQAQLNPDEVARQRSHAGMPDATAVWTEPDHHLVGLIGHAPQRAFLAPDSRLDGLQVLLEQQYPDARVQMSGLNPALTRGMVQIWVPDRPPRYVFFSDSGGLTEYAQLEPDLSVSTLGRTHIERSWAEGMPVAVTLPPQGVTPLGVLVEPFTATAQDAEEPLDRYDGVREVLRAGRDYSRARPGSTAGLVPEYRRRR
jgi:hypothetical protein